MSGKETRHVVRLTLEALPDDVPAPARLRYALKVLLRSCRLKCLVIEQEQLDDQDFRPQHLIQKEDN